MSIRTIVLGTDFSAPATRGARWVLDRFAPDVRLVIVHTVDVPPAPAFLPDVLPPHDELVKRERARAESLLTGQRKALGSERVETEVRVGQPADELAAAAVRHSADLIVVGAHGDRRSFWPGPGSTVERLLVQAPVPVLVAQAMPEAAPGRILAAVDDSPFTDPVLRWARELSDAFDAEVVALHVLTQVLRAHLRITSTAEKAREVERRARQSSEAWLSDRLRAAGLRPDRSVAEVAVGRPAYEILAALERTGAELVVLGTRGAGLVGRTLVGSVARSIVRGANCPVLMIVRPAGVEDGRGAK